MKCKECKIVCDGKEMAKIDCTKEGIVIKCSDDCKNLGKEFFGGCC